MEANRSTLMFKRYQKFIIYSFPVLHYLIKTFLERCLLESSRCSSYHHGILIPLKKHCSPHTRSPLLLLSVLRTECVPLMEIGFLFTLVPQNFSGCLIPDADINSYSLIKCYTLNDCRTLFCRLSWVATICSNSVAQITSKWIKKTKFFLWLGKLIKKFFSTTS